MDPISAIEPGHDSTLAIMLALQQRGAAIWYMQPEDVAFDGDADQTLGRMRPVTVQDDADDWYQWGGDAQWLPLTNLDAVLQRRDPPFDMNYIYQTYFLESARQQGGLTVINDPVALRSCNEKYAITDFLDVAPPLLISANTAQLQAFHRRHETCVFKPLDGMGGADCYKISPGESNFNVICEHLTRRGEVPIMAQRFIPEIADGDKRLFLINGEPLDHVLVRTPPEGDVRANMAVGGTTTAAPLSDADRRIARAVGPKLVERGVMIAGLDVIGEYLTEVNITSPTGLRELHHHTGSDPSLIVADAVLAKLSSRQP